jgi:hypothetical protein
MVERQEEMMVGWLRGRKRCWLDGLERGRDDGWERKRLWLDG